MTARRPLFDAAFAARGSGPRGPHQRRADGGAHQHVRARPAVRDPDDGAGGAMGRAPRNLAPKSRYIGKRYIGNHRNYPFLTPDWSAP